MADGDLKEADDLRFNANQICPMAVRGNPLKKCCWTSNVRPKKKRKKEERKTLEQKVKSWFVMKTFTVDYPILEKRETLNAGNRFIT